MILQIHSIALALRLAAIRRFNCAAPIIVLDDVVTSYDADHRRNIASAIAAEFSGSQIIITTHDERFFNYLKDQLEAKDWHFKRIIGLGPYGPRFADHKVSDAMIEARWAEGQSAANEMRQAVTSVKVVEIVQLFEVAINQAALGGSWSGSASPGVVASSVMASSCM